MASPKYSPYYTYIKPVIQHEIVRSFLPYIFSLTTMTVLIFFAIRPTISTISNLQKSLDNNKEVLARIEQKAQNLTEGKQNLQNLDTQTVSKINNTLPQNPSVPYLIASLQNSLGSSASISALQIQPVTLYESSSLPSEKKLDEVSFAFNIQGAYPQLLATLDKLSRNPRLISIESIILNKQTEGALVLSVTGKAYYLK